MKRIITAAIIAASVIGLSACQDDADVASYNLSKAADNFEIVRRVVFYNGINGEYMLEVVGLCSINDQGNQLELTCKEGRGSYVKHFLGLSDNVTYFSQQIDGVDVSTMHTRVTWKPQSIVPDIDFRGSVDELTTNHSEVNQ